MLSLEWFGNQAVKVTFEDSTGKLGNRLVFRNVDKQRLLELLAERALVHNTMTSVQISEIREQMERASARRLQPHFIKAFFLEAFCHLGGKIHPREQGRWEITHVPGPVRERDRAIGIGEPVMTRYERVCFEKDKINQTPVAAFICPGHPLMNATIDLILERYGQLLKQGAVLVDEGDDEELIRVLFYLEHAVQDGRKGRGRKEQQVVSQRLQFVEYFQDGRLYDAGPAPYLDYRPATEQELASLKPYLEASWLCEDIERQVILHAVQAIVPRHIDEVRARRLHYIDKVESEVTTRLKKEINYWDRRAEELKAQKRAGKRTRLSSINAMTRADEIAERLQRRRDELSKERQITALPPVVRGGAIVVPFGLLKKSEASTMSSKATVETIDRDKIEELAMAAVMEAERNLGRTPRDVSKQRGLGYDIESKAHDTGSLFFIEVKGRWVENDSVTLTKNEILCSRNEPEKFRLALVSVDKHGTQRPRYIKGYEFGEPDFAETTRTFSMQKLLEIAGEPC